MTHSPWDLLQLNRERFLTAYQQTFNPLYQIAQNMGYVHKSEHAHPLIFAADADWKTIQDMFDKEHKWMTGQMQKHMLFSAWLSSCYSIATTTGLELLKNNLVIEHILFNEIAEEPLCLSKVSTIHLHAPIWFVDAPLWFVNAAFFISKHPTTVKNTRQILTFT